jgi:hypothetical protein
MMDKNEFLSHVRVNAEMLETWIGWCGVKIPEVGDLSDVDLARAQCARAIEGLMLP